MQPRLIPGTRRTVARLTRLWKQAEQSGAYRVATRLHAVVLNMEDGRTSGEIASLLKAPRSCVADWLSNYEAHGTEGLLEGHRSGRPCTLTNDQQQALDDIVESGPVAYGFTGGVWTGPMVARVLQDEFGVDFSAFHVRRILHAMGFSVQRPKRVLVRADKDQQDRWRRYIYPNIKKKPSPPANLLSSKMKPASAKTRRSTKRGHGSAVNR